MCVMDDRDTRRVNLGFGRRMFLLLPLWPLASNVNHLVPTELSCCLRTGSAQHCIGDPLDIHLHYGRSMQGLSARHYVLYNTLRAEKNNSRFLSSFVMFLLGDCGS